MSAGHVGVAHGLDGGFYVEAADHPLPAGTVVTVGGGERRVVSRAGTDERPLVRLSGIEDRDALAAVRGEPLLVDAELGEDEWLAVALIGREVLGLGPVRRVIDGPSCDLLELENGMLVPFVSDAIRSIGEVIEVDTEFLGL